MERKGLPPPAPKAQFVCITEAFSVTVDTVVLVAVTAEDGGIARFPCPFSTLALPPVSTFVHDHFIHSPLCYCNYSFIISFFSLPPVPLHLTAPSFTHLLSRYKTLSLEVFQLLSHCLWLHWSLVTCLYDTEGTNSHHTLKEAEAL